MTVTVTVTARPGPDETLSEHRRLEIGTAVVVGVGVWLLPNVVLWLVEPSSIVSVDSLWLLAGRLVPTSPVVLAVLVVLGWLLRARRREPGRRGQGQG